MEKTRPSFNLTIIYIFAIIPFLGINGIRNLIGTSAYQVYQVVSVLVLIMISFRKRYIKYDAYSCLYAFYVVEVFCVTTIRHGFSTGILLTNVAYIIFVFLMLQDSKSVLKAVAIITCITAVLNFISVLNIGRDEYALYFIGGKNQLSSFLIPALFLSFIYFADSLDKISFPVVIIFMLGLVSIFIAGSGTGVIVAILALVIAIVFYRFKVNKKVVLGVILAFYIVMILGSELLANNSLWITITTLLGKDSNLTYRTKIWSYVLELLKANPLFGLGRGTTIAFQTSWGGTYVVDEAHNMLLEVLLEGGIVGFILYMVAFFKAIANINLNSKQDRFLFAAIVLILINGMTEATTNQFFVVMTFALANCFQYGEYLDES